MLLLDDEFMLAGLVTKLTSRALICDLVASMHLAIVNELLSKLGI